MAVTSRWVHFVLVAAFVLAIQVVTAGGQGTRTRESVHRACIDCVVNNEVIKGHSRFQYDVGCDRFRCICWCNGTHTCPPRYTLKICDATTPSDGDTATDPPTQAVTESQTQRSEDTTTTIATRPPTTRPTSATRTTSRGREDSRRTSGRDDRRRRYRCQNCTAGGISRKGHSYFDMILGCTKFRYCVCRCNGEWSCPDRYSQQICSETATTPATTTTASPTTTVSPATESPTTMVYRTRPACRSCIIRGETYSGGSTFSLKVRCKEYTNCACRCDGKWSCNPRSARYICHRGTTTTRPTTTTATITTATTASTTLVNPIEPRTRPSCRTCYVKGQTHQGGSNFTVTVGCKQYSNCFCRCDGSWACPPSYAKNICDSEGTVTGDGNEKPTRPSCRTCFAYGKYFKSQGYFQVTDKCIHHKKCICRCDGSWSCQPRFSENICVNNRTTPGSRDGDTECSSCSVRGRTFKGNSYFDLRDGCMEYSNCLCRCDGSWRCPSQFTKNKCEGRTEPPATCRNCVAKGKIVRPNSKFNLVEGCIYYTGCDCKCNGSWNCHGNQARNICRSSETQTQPTSVCQTCRANDGRRHPANSPFTYREGCVEYNCDCHCNGSWHCPSTRSRWVCSEECRSCNVKGRKIANGTVFKHSTGCLEYSCNCHCNGSWNCPGHTAVNTCRPDVRNNCNQCRISDAEVYEGETDFVLRQGCLHYKCRCNCDGSYHCAGKDARNLCRGEVLGGCRSCVVSETDIFRGNSDFSVRRDCLHYECRCNCDGSWLCPPQKTRDVCLGERPGGCRVCKVDDEIFRSNTFFDLQRGCMHYKCRCNCDGGWNCPGRDARNVCKLEVPGGCRSCILSDTEFYRANSKFEVTRDCIRYQCDCNCDGGYTCPGPKAKRVCGSKPSGPRCSQCVMSNGDTFEGNSNFYLERHCYNLKCKCKCDGSWECPAKDAEFTCPGRRPKYTYQNGDCKPCNIGANIFPGDSSFKFTRRCHQYDCKCDCVGRWTCDHTTPTNICRKDREKHTSLDVPVDSKEASAREDLSASTPHITLRPESGNTLDETDIGTANITSSTANNDSSTEPESTASNDTSTEAGMNATDSQNVTDTGEKVNATMTGENDTISENGTATAMPSVNGTMTGENDTIAENSTTPATPSVNGTTTGVNGTMTENGTSPLMPPVNGTAAGENGTMAENSTTATPPVNGTTAGENGTMVENSTTATPPVNGTTAGENGTMTENSTTATPPVNGTTAGENGTMTENSTTSTPPVNGTTAGENGTMTDNSTTATPSVNGTTAGENGTMVENSTTATTPVNGTTAVENGTMTEYSTTPMVPSMNGTTAEENGTMNENGTCVNGTMMGENGTVTGNGTCENDTLVEENGTMSENVTCVNGTMIGENGTTTENATCAAAPSSVNGTMEAETSPKTDVSSKVPVTVHEVIPPKFFTIKKTKPDVSSKEPDTAHKIKADPKKTGNKKKKGKGKKGGKKKGGKKRKKGRKGKGKGKGKKKNCKVCLLGKKKITPNRRFQYRKKCTSYKKCKCHCDGTWTCPVEIDLCKTTTPSSMNDSPFSRINAGSRNALDQVQGEDASVKNNQRIEGGDEILLTTGGDEENGDVYAVKFESSMTDKNDLQPENPLRDLEEPCLNCHIGKYVYTSKSFFNLLKGCDLYTCHCNCDGSHVCPEDEMINIC